MNRSNETDPTRIPTQALRTQPRPEPRASARAMLRHPKTVQLLCAAISASLALGAAQQASPPPPETSADPFSAMPIWDDGLSEMCYYDGRDKIYGKERTYTRVILVNRQWMDPASGVKADPKRDDSIPVFKMNIAEEIPTENYNYRFLTTLFLKRPDLRPFKMVVSSQEWCGTTFKHARWRDDAATWQSFSYFPDEGDRTETITPDAAPYESLLLLARSAVADGRTRFVNLLPDMRSNRLVEPKPKPARLSVHDAPSVTLRAGTFPAKRVKVRWDGPDTSFLVEANPPYRLLEYHQGDASGELVFVERRPYWDRNSKSAFHNPDHAP